MAAIYEIGMQSFKEGFTLENNPHNRHSDSLAYNAWRGGFQFAQYLASVKG